MVDVSPHAKDSAITPKVRKRGAGVTTITLLALLVRYSSCRARDTLNVTGKQNVSFYLQSMMRCAFWHGR